MSRYLVFIIAGWSGFFVMAVELLSGRILAPHFGNSIYVWGGIITVFMLALSIGYLIGGRLSVQQPSLRKLSVILISAALSTAPVALIGETAFENLFSVIQDPRYGSLLSATIFFFVPTLISGMISPYAVRLLVKNLDQSGNCAGMLYFVSTFGSAAGTILTSFYLVLYLEVNLIVWILIGISMLMSIVAFFAGGRNAENP